MIDSRGRRTDARKKKKTRKTIFLITFLYTVVLFHAGEAPTSQAPSGAPRRSEAERPAPAVPPSRPAARRRPPPRLRPRHQPGRVLLRQEHRRDGLLPAVVPLRVEVVHDVELRQVAVLHGVLQVRLPRGAGALVGQAGPEAALRSPAGGNDGMALKISTFISDNAE